MSPSNILVVVVDGLRASALGAYGNTIYRTPALDRFAAESLLFDSCFATGTELSGVYRSLWQALHPLRPVEAGDLILPLPRRANDLGYQTTLISDEESVLAFPGAEVFEVRINASKLAIEASDAPLPSLYSPFSAAVAAIERANADGGSHLVWLHAQGLYGRWDAPRELREQLRDEDDPPAIGDCDSPCVELQTENSDEAFSFACAYAAMTMVLDECWNGLWESLHQTGGGNWLVVLVGARGFPLGEHGRIGGVDRRLFAEQLHVPLLVRFPDGRGRLFRRAELVSHEDISATIADWITDLAERSDGTTDVGDGRSLTPLANAESVAWRDELLSSSNTCRGLRTREWSFRGGLGADVPETGTPMRELFVRPDDRWEANDIATRCPEELTELAQRAEDMAKELSRGPC